MFYRLSIRIWAFCCLGSCAAQAQINIAGRVLDADSRQPLPGANVFFANTTKGTQTNAEGQFQLRQVSRGNYELIVSFVGYETISRRIEVDTLMPLLTVLLSPKAQALAEVKIKPRRDPLWATHYRLFLENFVGATPNGLRCKIKNPKALWFDDDRKQQLLTGGATEVLVIENEALGYRIKYQLEGFNYDYRRRYVTYLGYPAFEEIEPKNERQAKRWEQQRQKAYYGSVTHYMRSLVRRRVAQEGFITQKIIETTDTVRNVTLQVKVGDSFQNRNPTRKMQVLLPDTLQFERLAEASEPGRVKLLFNERLQVIYTKAFEEPEYQQLTGLNRLSTTNNRLVNRPQTSRLLMLSENVVVLSDGNYYDPLNLILEGYWGWKKMADTLPLDYQPN
jgi:hypothetical protein